MFRGRNTKGPSPLGYLGGWRRYYISGKGGELLGYDVDFIYRFCRKYGYKPQITPLGYDAMAAALASGKCSVAMGLIEDAERAEEVHFTNSYISYDIIALYYQNSHNAALLSLGC